MQYEYPPADPRIEAIAREALAYMRSHHPIKDWGFSRVRTPQREKLFIGMQDIFVDMLKCYGEGSDKVEFAFHGTGSHNIISIIDRGLLAPGDKGYIKHNGNAYGQGTYTTSSFSYALNYAANGGAVLVLAILPGKQEKVTTNLADQELPCNSVRAGHIVVLQGSSQVLPLFCMRRSPGSQIPQTLEEMEVCNFPTQDAYEVALQLKEVHTGVDLSVIIALVTKAHNVEVAKILNSPQHADYADDFDVMDREAIYAAVNRKLTKYEY